MAGWQHPRATERQERLDPSDQVNCARSEPPGFSNVVLFPHRPLDGATSVPAIVSIPQDRPPPTASAIPARAIYGGLLVVSVAVHAAFLVFLNREPTPTPSLGEEVISVEIVVGANTQAGNAERPGEAEIDNSPVKEAEKPPAETAEEAKPEEKPVEPEPVRTAEEPQTVEEALPSAIAVVPEERPQEKPIREADQPRTSAACRHRAKAKNTGCAFGCVARRRARQLRERRQL